MPMDNSCVDQGTNRGGGKPGIVSFFQISRFHKNTIYKGFLMVFKTF